METPAEVKINRKAAGRIASGHPWIFTSDIADRGTAASGDAVRVIDPSNRLVGTAHFSSASQITLRMLSTKAVDIDRAFLMERLTAALEFRTKYVEGTDSYRLVYGEADQLPGLVVDRYGDYLVLQALDQGMDRLTPLLVDCLVELCQPQAIVARNDVAVRSREALPLETKVLFGEVSGPIAIRMNGMVWSVDLMSGQKTGIFLDQRENYLAAAKYAHGKGLDCFTCTGGFALHMSRRCDTVDAVDSSEHALSIARTNGTQNGVGNVHWMEANAFDVLAGHQAAGRKFQTIVLDPPAFTKSRGTVDGALRGYKEINLRALKLLDRGGVLITNSCSHHVSEAMLLEVIAESSLDAHKTLRILERRTQAADHPILLTVPETLYLKCLIFQVV